MRQHLVKSCLAQFLIFTSIARSGVYSAVVDPFLSCPCLSESLPHIVYHNLLPHSPPPHSSSSFFCRKTSLGLVQSLCSGIYVPRWQCMQVHRDTGSLGKAVGFQVLLWCLAALCLCLTKPSSSSLGLNSCQSFALLHSLKPSVVCNTGIVARWNHRNRVAFLLIEGCACFALAAPQSQYQRV